MDVCSRAAVVGRTQDTRNQNNRVNISSLEATSTDHFVYPSVPYFSRPTGSEESLRLIGQGSRDTLYDSPRNGH